MCERLLKDEVINSTFNCEVFYGDGYFTLIFSGEAEKPELIREAVFAEIDRLIAEGVNEKDFQRVKKSAYGVMVRELNNVEAVASLMLNAYMENVSPYDSISIMSELTCGDVIDFMRSQLRRDRCVLSVIETED
jgi:predicted Zn-dependent peptidase